MNYLVFLDAQASALEKILSGVKSMIVKEPDPGEPNERPVEPGDCLYFLRDNEEYAVRAMASVVQVFTVESEPGDVSCTLKELQLKLQLTEEQFCGWAAKRQVQLVTFGTVRKTPVVQVDPGKVKGRSGWIAFEELTGVV